MSGIQIDQAIANLGIKFSNKELLQQAFIHRSYLNETKQLLESNERLEFLGDAILSFIISSYLYSLRPTDDEGNLTNLRSHIVKTKSLAEAASNLQLGNYLKLSKGEDASGGRKNPQLLANTYEALLGAVYLDQGLVVAKNFIDLTLLPLFKTALESGPPKDAKSELQELIQNTHKESPLYKILSTKGPDHAKEFTVGVFIQGKEQGKGIGPSKQIAEEQAAIRALQKLTNSIEV